MTYTLLIIILFALALLLSEINKISKRIEEISKEVKRIHDKTFTAAEDDYRKPSIANLLSEIAYNLGKIREDKNNRL